MDPDGRRQQVALFRYSLIRPLADPELGPRERGALVRALVSVDHVGPDGHRVDVSAPTLRRWLRAWRRDGFGGLVPTVRAQPTGHVDAEAVRRFECTQFGVPPLDAHWTHLGFWGRQILVKAKVRQTPDAVRSATRSRGVLATRRGSSSGAKRCPHAAATAMASTARAHRRSCPAPTHR
ncbi:MAG: hypothetical protein ACRD0U_14315 [Acidimicrobiales bacterium]